MDYSAKGCERVDLPLGALDADALRARSAHALTHSRDPGRLSRTNIVPDLVSEDRLATEVHAPY